MAPSITSDSSFFYACLTIIILINCILAEKTKKNGFLFVLLNVFILTFVFGFRAYTVGRDTPSYVLFFYHPDSSVVSLKDPVFTFICQFLMGIFPNPSFLFLVYGFTIFGLINFRFWELRDSLSYSYAFMTFYCLYFFSVLNGLRQFIAVAIVFWGSRYLLKKNYLKFIASVFIAMFFHATSIISFVLFGTELCEWKRITKSKRKVLVLLVIIGLASIVYLFMTGYLQNKFALYQHYLNNAEIKLGFRVLALMAIFVASLFLYENKQTNGEFKTNIYFLSSLRVNYILACLLAGMEYYIFVAGRLAWFFMPFVAAYVGVIVNEKKQINRWIMKMPIIIVLIYSIVYYIWMSNGNYCHPYRFIWS